VEMVRIAAISDMHLGAPTSYLTVESVRQRLLRSVVDHAKGHLDLLVLVGDVIDLTVGRAPEPWVAAREFFAWMGTWPVDIGRIVYIPGNHDHHVWVMLAEYMEVLSKIGSLASTPVGGENTNPLLGTAYPFWTPMHNLFPRELSEKVVFAYPFFYFPETITDTRFVFHHGHYFDRQITPLAGFAGKRYRSLAKIEAFNLPYIESLYYLCSWDPLVQKTELFFYDAMVNGRLSLPGRTAELFNRILGGRGKQLGGCDLRQIDRMMEWIGFKSAQLRANDIWVFGHTHICDEYPSSVAPKALRLFDLGGWLLNHNPSFGNAGAWSSPAIFYWDEKSGPSLDKIQILEEEKQSVSVRVTPLASPNWLRRLLTKVVWQ